MALARPCLGCGRTIRSGSRCRTCAQAANPRRGRPYRRLREQILERDRWRCRYCGRPAAQVDHVIPLARGGTNDPSNLAAACARCNGAKGPRQVA